MSIKLLLAITTHNEEDHIELQLDNAIELGCYDKIVILDDGSTDSTCEIIEKYLDKNKNIYLFKNELNSVLNNGENRWVTISNIIRDGGFNPDWVNNRAADILYPINSGGKLLSQVEALEKLGAETISISFVNLWRSNNYYRVDGWWGSVVEEERMKVLWKYDDNFNWEQKECLAGLHQGASIPNVSSKKNIGISSGLAKYGVVPGIHYGMSTHNKMVERFRWSMEKATAASKIGKSFSMPPPSEMPPVVDWPKYNGYKVFHEFGINLKRIKPTWYSTEDSQPPKVESLYEVILEYNKTRAEEYKQLFEGYYGNS